MGRRFLVAALACAMLGVGFPLGASPAAAVSADIVISQVYGGGGNSGATLKNDFIELFNRGTAAVATDGRSVQYAAAARSPWTNPTAALRGTGGCIETDNNGADFTAGTPGPRNTSSAFNICPADVAPSITATSPIAGASGVSLDSNITLTFSEPVNVSVGWFSITCGVSLGHAAPTAGGPTVFTLDPDANFAPNESCTVTVVASKVEDQDANDPPNTMAADFVFSFQTADVLVCGAPATRIHDIQGSGLTSPMV